MASQMSLAPSPLDRPGLDDPPLREWVADGEDGNSMGLADGHARATHQFVTPLEFRPDPAWTDQELEDELPERASERNPISIELVRGANGPGNDVDQWTVLIDGVRCNPVARPDATFQGEEKVYHLPLPFEDARSLNDSSLDGGPTSVRPLAFGVRIEAEALRPAKVELVMEQVVESGDTEQRQLADADASFWVQSGQRSGEEEVAVISTQVLSSYTPLDTVAPCITTPYPLRAPATSALGLLHFNKDNTRGNGILGQFKDAGKAVVVAAVENQKTWEENAGLQNEVNRTVAQSLIRRALSQHFKRNERQAQLDDEQTTLNSDRDAAIAGIQIANVDQSQLATRELRNLQPDDVQSEWRAKQRSIRTAFDKKQKTLDNKARKFEEDGKHAKMRIYIPKQPLLQSARVPLRLPNAFTASKPQGDCTVLGGNVEAVADLTTQFEKLEYALKMAKLREANKQGYSSDARVGEATATERVNSMRRWLVQTGESKATRLLETLLLSKPNFVSFNRKGADWAEAKKQQLEIPATNTQPAKKLTTEEVYEKKYDFKDTDASYLLVDRMSFEALRSSSCRIRFRLKVTDSGSSTSTKELLFEASAMHGYLANAAYTDAPRTVDRLREQMGTFYKNLMQDLQDETRSASLWRTAVKLVKDAPDDFQFVAKAMLDYWDRDATYKRRRDRISESNLRAWAFALGTSADGSGGNLFQRALGATTTRYTSIAASVGTEVYDAWLQTAAEDAEFDLARERGLYARNSTVSTLRYLTAPGMNNVVKEFLEAAFEDNDDKEYFTADKISDGFASLRGTLYELEEVVRQTLPHSMLHDLGADRGAKLAADALEAGENSGAFLAAYQAKDAERNAEAQQRRDLYCRMPQIVAPSVFLPPRFTDPKNDVCMDLDFQDVEAPSWWNSRLTHWFSYATASAMTYKLAFYLTRRWELSEYEKYKREVNQTKSWFGGSSFALTTAANAAVAYFFPAVGGVAASSGVVSYLLDSTVNFLGRSYSASRQDQQMRGPGGIIDQRSADVALQSATYVFNVIRSYHVRKLVERKDGEEKYKHCMRKARGNPVTAAVANASETLRTLRRTLDLENDLGAVNGDGTRFRFYERFSVRRVELEGFAATLVQPHTQNDWKRLPDGLALRFVPPPELVAQVFEGETLRRTPLNAAIARVSETLAAPSSQSGTNLARLAAQRIHTEMQAIVRDHWLLPFRAHPSGAPARRCIGRTAPRTATLLAKEACALLRAAFTAKTPTLIDDDDHFFDCFAGGGAARLAMRQIPTIAQTLGKISGSAQTQPSTATAYLKAARVEWTAERRAAIDTLCKMWEEVATASSNMLVPQLDVAVASREALASFLRVRELSTLANKRSMGPMLATASAMTALYAIVGPDADPQMRNQGLRGLAQASTEVEGFRYQEGFSKPEAKEGNLSGYSTGKVAFAARRLDVEALATAPVGDGVDALVEALGPAKLLTANAETEHYYVACGDNLDFQPSPLLYSGAVAQPVWLQDVADACDRLLATLATSPAGPAVAAANGVALLRPRTGTEPGLARHPLVVTRQSLGDNGGDAVGVRLLKQDLVPLTLATPEAESAMGSLLGAMALLRHDASKETRQRADLAADVARVATGRSRILAFNADRCAAGLALAAEAPRTEVDATSGAPTALEVAFGMAMTETTSDEVVLRTPEPDYERHNLEDLRTVCQEAMKQNCKVVTLAEMSLAFMDRRGVSE